MALRAHDLVSSLTSIYCNTIKLVSNNYYFYAKRVFKYRTRFHLEPNYLDLRML